MTDSWIFEALSALDAARRGDCPPLEFLSGGRGDPPRWIERPDVKTVCQNPPNNAQDTDIQRTSAHYPGEPGPERVVAVVQTSGSTGTPKQALLGWEALEASAQMTAEALGGHGQWLLALQPSYVAGLAVLTRSLVAGTEPVGLLEGTTDPRHFAEAAELLTHERRYVSLVPTQLQRLLEHQGSEVLQALRRFDAILLGGGPTSTELFGRARQLGLNVIRTYGMAETCGGCVYDGYPLPGVAISIGTHGRVLLSGPMVALGYHDAALTAERFETDPATGHRRFRTDDLGQLSTQRAEDVDTIAQVTGAGHAAQIVPKLTVTGRADDVIITGGVKVSAEQVRRAVESHPSVREAFVAGIDDAEWGQKVAAAVVLGTASRQGNTFEEIDRLVRDRLGAPAVPKHYELLGALPLLPNSKPDRQALLRLLTFGGHL
ncbi:AMP-binding protein [Nesterenkonia ebinurensis]|uniref:AMP-binding protein n=1 Tax=Nesterenkonia ebinurensis TaxID=2608252 RepID=UPI001CC44A3C|nr:AMP-binding protein [Nesterenkonia ebinurensis]